MVPFRAQSIALFICNARQKRVGSIFSGRTDEEDRLSGLRELAKEYRDDDNRFDWANFLILVLGEANEIVERLLNRACLSKESINSVVQSGTRQLQNVFDSELGSSKKTDWASLVSSLFGVAPNIVEQSYDLSCKKSDDFFEIVRSGTASVQGQPC